MESFLSPHGHNHNHSSSNRYNGTGTSCLHVGHGETQDNLNGTIDLIANLDHELWDVRLRALKCILRKLDCGIISSKFLSQRVDLLNRLSEWLRSASEISLRESDSPGERNKAINLVSANQGIPVVIELLLRLAEHKDARHFILKEKVDCRLAKLRLQLSGESKVLLDRVLDCLYTNSFDFQCEGPPEIWDDNTSSLPALDKDKLSGRYTISESSFRRIDNMDGINQGDGDCLRKEEKSNASAEVLDVSGTSAGDFYFQTQSVQSVVDKTWASAVKFGIPSVHLSGTDRRVLASTVESLLSKNESLIFMTSCFVRDVLLQDYPPEVFIQESALSMAFLEVAESSWNDPKVQYVAVQGLLKLSSLLRFRISQYNSSEYYQITKAPQKGTNYYENSSYPPKYGRGSSSHTTDLFVGNICQLLKSLSRSILFQAETLHLWKLMDSFSFTLYKCVNTFPVDSKSLTIGLQEVLLDLSHCFEKNMDEINTPALALCLSSILRSLHINDETFIIASDVRKCLRNLICCPRLFHCWPEVYQYLLQYASPFDDSLTPVSEKMELVCKGLEEMSNVLNISENVEMTAETLLEIKEAIPNLQIAESEDSVDIFLNRAFVLCTNPIYQNLLSSVEEKMEVIFQLMGHSCDPVRRKFYSLLRGLVKKHIGPERSPSLLNSSEENIALSIILNRKFLKEILHFGTTDTITEVQHFAEEIILFLMKSKSVVGAELWERILTSITSFLPILESHADLQTVLGKAVLNFCDPSTNEHGLSEYELLCSNLRLLYSSNLRVREEGSERLMKVLSETETGAVTFRYASYSNYTLASMFSIGRNLDISEELASFKTQAPSQTGNLLRMLETCRAEDLESVVRKNSLIQVSMLMEDPRLHDTFCNQGGVELMTDIIARIASEKDFKYPMDMWPPAVRILKLVCMQSSPKMRKVLSEDYNLLVNLTCGLFSLRADDRFRVDTVHLMTLLLFNSLEKFSDDGRKFYLPQIILSKYRIPIVTEGYLKTSSYRSSQSDLKTGENGINLENFPVDKVYKAWWTLGKTTSKVINRSQSFSPFDDSFQELKPHKNEFQPQEKIVKLLFAVQNATSHGTVIEALDGLWSNLLPLVINTRLSVNLVDYICKDAPWRDAFYRFLCVEPTCVEDEDLLIRIVDLLEFLISNMKEEVTNLTEWIIPLCLEKGCAGLRLISEHSLKTEAPYSGTMLPTLLRSLFDFYGVMFKKNGVFIENEYLWDAFSTFCLIFHELGEKEFSYAAVLQPILHGLATFTSKDPIRCQLQKNPKFVLALIHRATEVIISLQDRSGGVSSDSYRNQGALYYSSLSLLHLILVISEEQKTFGDWMGKCSAVIPCLWESRDVRVRAVGFQLSEVITYSSKGSVVIMTIMESPSIIWKSAYGALMDFEEAAVVKHKAAKVLLNLLNQWSDIQSSGELNKTLLLPSWSTIDDFTKLLTHVYWLPTLSEFFKVGDNDGEFDDASNSSYGTQLVTPKVLSITCKILIAMTKSNMEEFHPEGFKQAICSSGLCPLLFRLTGTHSVSTELEPTWWFDCCSALSNVVETLICMTQLDRSVSVILIGDKRSLASLVQLFLLGPLSDRWQVKSSEILSALWVNIFTLLSILCADSGNNFEDLERCIWGQRNVIFSRLTDWLKQDALVKCRKIALTFTHGLLSKVAKRQQEKETVSVDSNSEIRHPVLCREWKERKCTYGSALCQSLMSMYEDSISAEEKQSVLNTLSALIVLSPSAKTFAIDHDLIGVLIEKLKSFGLKYFDSMDTGLVGKKSVNQWHDETICILSVLSALVYRNEDAKKSALFNGMVDAFHKIFKWWKSYPDRTLLHAFIETLMNFTEEFVSGSQALTVTTSVVGVGPKKVPTPHSFLFEVVGILQMELGLIEKNPNVKTVELIFEFLKNCVFVVECRNVLLKTSIPDFLKKLHVREMKKWGQKQHHIKSLYLNFLVHLSVHQDVQSAVAKVPEAVEILILIVDLDDKVSSLLALKIIRNLSFQPANRARFLCDEGLMPALSAKIRESDELEEIESAAVGLWALISNSEKGKLLAKKSFCHTSVSKAIARLRKLENTSNDLQAERRDLSNLLNVLTTLANVLGFPAAQTSV